MKHHSFSRFLLAGTAVLLVTFAGAQTPAMVIAKANPPVLAAAPVADPDEIVLDGLKLRNEKMHTHFLRNFKGAKGISVFPSEKTTVIYFHRDGIRSNVLYTNKGRLLHTVRYYEASLLPSEVARMVRDGFPEYKANYVSEVTIGNQTAYMVNVESMTHFKIVRVLDGEWDVYREYDKAP